MRMADNETFIPWGYRCAAVPIGLDWRPQSRACARRALILAFSHKGRRDLSLAIHA